MKGRGKPPARAPARSSARPAHAPPADRPGLVRVDGHSTGWLQKGFAWVYPTEVRGRRPEPGEEVVIVGASGESLGRGVGDDGWIAVRRFRTDGGPLDAAWFATLVDRAVRLRERLLPGPHTTAVRLIHGENDDLPGVRVDRWDRWLVIVLDSPSLEGLLDRLVPALVARLHPEGIRLAWRLDARDTHAHAPEPRWIWGRPPEGEVIVHERGLALSVRLDEAPDVGAFPDMRDVRAWLAPHWAGTRVLNLFAYTGAFSVAAALGGAAEVVSVDLSRGVLDRLAANLQLNGVDPATTEIVAEDAFRALDRLRRTGRLFDRVVVDPPSFSHGPEGTWSSGQALDRLVAAAARVVAPDGWLVIASNHGQTSPRAFRGALVDGLRKAGRTARELTFLGAAPDHPAAVHFPEGHYLKVSILALDGA